MPAELRISENISEQGNTQGSLAMPAVGDKLSVDAIQDLQKILGTYQITMDHQDLNSFGNFLLTIAKHSIKIK